MTAPSTAYSEGESYVCAVCALPVRPCNTDPTVCCADKILSGTELQLLREEGKRRMRVCVRCGAPLSKRVLQKRPFAELCSRCQLSSHKSKNSKRLKGASL